MQQNPSPAYPSPTTPRFSAVSLPRKIPAYPSDLRTVGDDHFQQFRRTRENLRTASLRAKPRRLSLYEDVVLCYPPVFLA